jgi:asparagine synthase (glutamine-hydrolysing)
MQRHVGDRIKTFSVGYDGRYYSELPYARQVAQQIGSDHHEVLLGADDFYDAVARLTWHEDEPLWGTASVALYFVSTLAADHVKVVLTGEGSDELFAGYDRYWMTALNARALGVYRVLPKLARSALRRALVNGPLPERLRRSLGHTFLNYDTMPDGLFLDSWFGVFPPAWQARAGTPSLRRELAETDVYASHRALFDAGHARDLVDRLLYTDIHASLVELLMKQDQMSMATSIESRVPFLDHHLVEFAATVPARHKIRRTSGKHLVKNALAGLLPDSIRHRVKKGFPVPWEQWLGERYAAPIERLLTESRSLDRGWLDAAAVRQLFADHRAGAANHSRQIWTLWGLELWARACLDGERPAELVRPPARSKPGTSAERIPA